MGTTGGESWLKLASKNIGCMLSLWDQMYSDPGEQLMFRLPLEIFLTMSRPAGCSILSHASLPYVYNTVPLNSYNRTHSLIFQLVLLCFLDHYVWSYICHWNCFAITAMRVETLDHRISKAALGGNDHVPSIMKQQINSVDGTERDWGMTNGQWLSVCSGSRAVGHPLVSWW